MRLSPGGAVIYELRSGSYDRGSDEPAFSNGNREITMTRVGGLFTSNDTHLVQRHVGGGKRDAPDEQRLLIRREFLEDIDTYRTPDGRTVTEYFGVVAEPWE